MACGRVCVVLLFVIAGVHVCLSVEDEEDIYVNEWAVKIPGGERVAREVAVDYGFHFDGKIGSLPDMYALTQGTGKGRSKRAADDINRSLADDERVEWVEQQQIIVHQKKGYEDVLPPDETGDDWAIPFNDPLWPVQWYLYNDGQRGATPGMDMNLMPAWKLGVTGKGVVVTIVDDGMDQFHPDLRDNFDKYASFDFNNRSNLNSPTPDYRKPAQAVRHGTRCAGEVAGAANNSVCGVGAAYEASIGGLRLLDGPVTDRLTADAINFNNSHIDIYSCCWGPIDDGTRFEMPRRLTRDALEEGTRTGRNGKGSIFVWASGNGGNDDDDCSADGYVSNIHTISISSINDNGRSVYFTESCPSTFAVTLSGGPHSLANFDRHTFGMNFVATTDLYGNCTDHFVGTSSAAPLASGILALVLQANPQLTWRDVQYIITEGCNIPQPYESGWHINGAGHHVHHIFGFGVLDAGKMVKLALMWDLVPPQKICDVDAIYPDVNVKQGRAQNVSLNVNCPDIRSLEHTQAHISFSAPRRGDISLTLYSPDGTPSQLLSTRLHDKSVEGLVLWPFMTVHHWGEDPNGLWTLEFRYNPTPPNADKPEDETLGLRPRVEEKVAMLLTWGMTVYGIEELHFARDEDAGSDGGEDEVVAELNEIDNPAVNPDDAGKSDQGTIVKIYNNEQEDSEEINLDPGELGDGVALPPNAAHNIDKDDGRIETGDFDGYLLNKYGRLTLLEGFSKRTEDGGPILRYLLSLDDKSLEMLVREFQLYDVLDRYLKRDDGNQREGASRVMGGSGWLLQNRDGGKGSPYEKRENEDLFNSLGDDSLEMKRMYDLIMAIRELLKNS